MREDICTIPISEVFEPRDGCPICRMRDMLEDRMATYITGAAMMEPDVRIETNRLGFCKDHFDQILARGSRLSVALILESLLHEVEQDVFPEGKADQKTAVKKLLPAADRRAHSCFVCENIETNMEHLMETVIKLWQNEPDFRTLYAQQPCICFPHYRTLLKAGTKMNKKLFPEFQEATRSLALKYLHEVEGDITHFCRMFDYRNKDGDWGNSRDSIERAIWYLTSRQPQVETNAGEKNR